MFPSATLVPLSEESASVDHTNRILRADPTWIHLRFCLFIARTQLQETRVDCGVGRHGPTIIRARGDLCRRDDALSLAG